MMDMDMPGMTSGGTSDGSSSSNTSHAAMAMVFQWIIETPIYSYAFTPKTTGQYVGALFFLIVLCIINRALIAFASRKEMIWRAQESSRKIIIAGKKYDEDQGSSDGSVREVKGPAPWRWQVDMIRALLSTLNVGLHFLLMFAVMSLNVGYFFAVLIGTFLGDLMFARYGR
ncbi:hypothetical protein TWF694_006237 [Orbilia ellipsospora]|uniref:Copper transport protein n=1 Tax=Orbilia ellipsospora TaxID=2528407 RepID=A0AAV9XKZ8_9PEZI